MNWLKNKRLFFVISILFLVPGIYSLIRFGLRPSIDFTGGTVLELKFEENIPMDRYAEMKEILKENDFETSSIQSSGEGALLFRLKSITEKDSETMRLTLSDKFGEAEKIRFETIGPKLGSELLTKTLAAVALAAGFILAYVAWQFKKPQFGVCAILAMFHDTLILLGSFSLLGHFFGVEVDTLFVTAVLTVLSFSVHDTVVVYDRIRESQRVYPKADLEEISNKAITETLPRSLNNSWTIIFMLVALLLLGGETIRWFVVALLIGTISGTYSSTFTAVPLLIVWSQIASSFSSAPGAE